MRSWLVVFAKEPEAGRVKTRLCPPLSPGEAAGLYRCLLLDVLDETAAAAVALGLDAVLAVDPPSALAPMAVRAPASFRVIAQDGPDLGARMTRVARQAAAAGADHVLLRGSDSPCLDREVLARALDVLARADVVLGPDPDGGYGLVGLGPRALTRGPSGGLFAHPMSTPTVLRDTTAHAERLGLAVALLPPSFDVDRFDDLRRLALERLTSVSIPCRRTLAFLDERRLWPAGAAQRVCSC